MINGIILKEKKTSVQIENSRRSSLKRDMCFSARNKWTATVKNMTLDKAWVIKGTKNCDKES